METNQANQDIQCSTSNDYLSKQNICAEKADLWENSIRKLEPDKIEPNTILWLKTIAEPCYLYQIKAVLLVVEDRNKKNKAYAQLCLYNQEID